MSSDLQFHEAANIFPLDDEHIPDLAADIKAHGLKYPIEMLDGMILDGRRRWLACRQADVKPTFVSVNPDDPVDHVVSTNIHRRHSTISQLGICCGKADKLQAKYAAEAKERMRKGGGDQKSQKAKSGKENSPYPISDGQSRDKLGATFGVSGQTADRGKHVVRDGIPEVVQAVEQNHLSINRADRISRLPKPQQQRALKAALAPRSTSPRAAKPKKATPDAPPEGELQGVGVLRGHEAIDCLKRIPKNDRLRKRGFQVVTDWIRQNK